MERTYFRPPPPPPVVRHAGATVVSERLATAELPLLRDEPEPAKAERRMPGWLNEVGEAVWYFTLALTAGYGAFRLIVDVGAQFIAP